METVMSIAWLLMRKRTRASMSRSISSAYHLCKIIISPPKSSMHLCVERDLGDKERDAHSCIHTSVSKGFKYEAVKTLVQLFVDHKSVTASEGGQLITNIPLGAEADEEEAEVTDTLLPDPGCDEGSPLPNAKQNVQTYADTFMPSEQAAFDCQVAVWWQALGCHHRTSRN